MPRISNSTFKVNDNLEQQIELTAVGPSVTIPISTLTALDVTSNLAEVHGSVITLGQKTSANSLPVTLPSDQGGLNVTSNLSYVNGQTISLGQTTNALSIPVVLASDDIPSVSSNIAGVDDSAKISSSTTGSAFQVGMYGWNGSQWRQANVSTTGNLKVESELEPHAGSQGNLANADAYTNGSNTVAIDVSNKTLLTLFGNKSDTSNGVQPQISADGTNYYDMDFEVYPNFTTGDFFQNIENVAVNHFRLKYNGAGTATATLLTNNH